MEIWRFFQEVPSVTTNGEGPILNLSDYKSAGTPPTCLSMIVKRTSGSTDSILVTLRISLDGVNWADVVGSPGNGFGAPLSVSNLGFGNNPAWAGFAGLPFCYARYKVVTVGDGNTLTIQLLAGRM